MDGVFSTGWSLQVCDLIYCCFLLLVSVEFRVPQVNSPSTNLNHRSVNSNVVECKKLGSPLILCLKIRRSRHAECINFTIWPWILKAISFKTPKAKNPSIIFCTLKKYWPLLWKIFWNILVQNKQLKGGSFLQKDSFLDRFTDAKDPHPKTLMPQVLETTL